MNAEAGLILLVCAFVGIPFLIALRYCLNRLTGRKVFPLWALFLILIGAPLAGSLFLDAAGTVHSLQVIEKRETLEYSHQFYRTEYWSQNFFVRLEQPKTQAIEEDSKTDLSLWVDAATYDALETGRSAEIRVFALGSWISFARPANRTTLSILKNWFPREPRGPWHEATATVEQISQFTEHVVRKPHSRSPYPWPYQIVRFRFTPAGRKEPIEAMENVEIARSPALTEKGAVQIRWPEDAPRSARILNARPGAPWANRFYVLGEYLVIGGIVIALGALYTLYKKRRKRSA